MRYDENLVADWLAIEADERLRMHEHHATNRPHICSDANRVGLTGEAEFAQRNRLYLDLERRPGGDGGIDFVIPVRHTVNIKTARKPLFLLVEKGQIKADIYVLARYIEKERRAELVGWECAEVIKRAPVRDFGKGVVSHYIAAEQLRPVALLEQRIMHLG